MVIIETRCLFVIIGCFDAVEQTVLYRVGRRLSEMPGRHVRSNVVQICRHPDARYVFARCAVKRVICADRRILLHRILVCYVP